MDSIFKRFFDKSPDLLCVFNHLGNFTQFNLEFEQQLGYSMGNLDKSFFDMIAEEDLEQAKTAISQLTSDKQSCLLKSKTQTNQGVFIEIDWHFSLDEAADSIFAIGRLLPKEQSQEYKDDFSLLLNNIKEEDGEELLNAMIQIFQKRIPSDIKELEDAISNTNMEVIQLKTHLVAGSLSSLGFDNGYKLAKAAEEKAISKEEQLASSLSQQLIDYLNEALASIRIYTE